MHSPKISVTLKPSKSKSQLTKLNFFGVVRTLCLLHALGIKSGCFGCTQQSYAIFPNCLREAGQHQAQRSSKYRRFFHSHVTPKAFIQLQPFARRFTITKYPSLFVYHNPCQFDDQYKRSQLYLDTNKKHKTQTPMVVHEVILNLSLPSLLKISADTSAEYTQTILLAIASVSANSLMEEKLV